MKKTLTFLTAFSFLFISQAPCQDLSEIWEAKALALGIEKYYFSGYTTTDTALYNSAYYSDLSSEESLALSVNLGWNIPIVTLADNLVAGVGPNVGFGTGLTEGAGYFLTAPVFATLKYGGDAGWGTRDLTPFGVGIGAGYQFTAGYSEAPVYTTGIGFAYGLPAAMAEICLVTGNDSAWKLRFHTTLKKTAAKDFSEDVGYETKIAISQWGISLIRANY